MSLKRNTIWNLVGMGVPFLVGVFTIPYLVRHLGVEAFGILTLIWALIGYFSLFDFGLGRALTQQISSCLGSNKPHEIPQLAKSGLIFTACTGVVGGLLLAGMARPLALNWLEVSAALESATTASLLIAALGIPLTTITTGLRGISEAYEDFKALNLIRILLGIATFGLPALSVVLFGPSLPFIVVMLVLARLLAVAGQWWLVGGRLPTGWLQSKAELRYIKRLLSFGAWMTVSNIISPLMVTADRFVIAGAIGASVVAYYSVPSEMMMRLLVLPAALTGALFPRLASFLLMDHEGAKALYGRCVKLVFVILAPLCAVVAVGAYWGLTLWLGDDFASKSWLIVSIMSLGILLNSIAYVPFATIQAAGEARITALVNLLVLLLYVPLLFVALYWFGIVGAAIAWVIRAALDVTLLLVCANKVLRRTEQSLVF